MNNLKQITGFTDGGVDTNFIRSKNEEKIMAEVPFQFGNQSNQVDFEGNPITEIPGNLDEVDIWEFAYKKLEPLGDVPKFIIYRNGEMLTTKMYPYSWQQLQEEFGGGHYKVQARSSNRQTIIKTQTQIIAHNPHTQPQQTTQDTFQAPSDSPSLEKLIDIVQNLQDKIKSESKQNDSLQLAAQANMNTTMMSMMQSQAKQTSDMIMQMTKFQMEMSNKQMEMMTKSLEGLGESLKSGKKDDGMDFIKLLTLLKETERSSEDRTMKFLELADKKAELAREQALEDNGSDEGGSKESLSDTLIRSFAPALGQIIAANAANQQQQRSLPQPQAIPPRAKPQPSQSVPRVEAKPNQTQSRPVKIEPRVTPKEQNVGANSKFNGGLKDKIESIVIPIVIEDLQNAVEPGLTAKKCVESLQKVGISHKEAIEKFEIDDILSVVRQFNMPEEHINWIKEVYANIKTAQIINPVPIRPTAPNAQLQA